MTLSDSAPIAVEGSLQKRIKLIPQELMMIHDFIFTLQHLFAKETVLQHKYVNYT